MEIYVLAQRSDRLLSNVPIPNISLIFIFPSKIIFNMMITQASGIQWHGILTIGEC